MIAKLKKKLNKILSSNRRWMTPEQYQRQNYTNPTLGGILS